MHVACLLFPSGTKSVVTSLSNLLAVWCWWDLWKVPAAVDSWYLYLCHDIINTGRCTTPIIYPTICCTICNVYGSCDEMAGEIAYTFKTYINEKQFQLMMLVFHGVLLSVWMKWGQKSPTHLVLTLWEYHQNWSIAIIDCDIRWWQ